MASTDLETQPSQDPKAEQEEVTVTKSSVYVDPFDPSQNRKFQKGDVVHMSIVANGFRRKGIFTVLKAHYNRSGRFWEYQLTDSKGLYDNGAFIRENYLKLER
ncbi:hypothetical protein M011DRAFT_463493 [Sporormia fimetaria CBS 119925]|uniref:Hypervirulence associated protein TUDOR domain-containing protein n=1 Tax=Sporormia fimetaria CBS 119925 TaxID=1340428 RepID=A0A6A6VN27_9PLEO|nr:hypothetical protein M011DRAFT_463493 [Sporormia fimetaria CBS 119925]